MKKVALSAVKKCFHPLHVGSMGCITLQFLRTKKILAKESARFTVSFGNSKFTVSTLEMVTLRDLSVQISSLKNHVLKFVNNSWLEILLSLISSFKFIQPLILTYEKFILQIWSVLCAGFIINKSEFYFIRSMRGSYSNSK